MQQGQPTDLELDMLLLFYTLSDQYGRVDVVRARTFLFQQYGILIPETPITIKEHHVQALVAAGMVPSVMDHLERIRDMKLPKKRKARKKSQDTEDRKDDQ